MRLEVGDLLVSHILQPTDLVGQTRRRTARHWITRQEKSWQPRSKGDLKTKSFKKKVALTQGSRMEVERGSRGLIVVSTVGTQKRESGCPLWSEDHKHTADFSPDGEPARKECMAERKHLLSHRGPPAAMTDRGPSTKWTARQERSQGPSNPRVPSLNLK